MNNKQLAEMIKTFRKEKMLEQIPGGIKEVIGPTHASSLNMTTPNIDKTPAGRTKFQGGNQKRNIRSYTAEENKKEIELGKTDTGQAGETVTSNPTDTTALAKGSMNKNTTTKEIKEKKNATMG